MLGGVIDEIDVLAEKYLAFAKFLEDVQERHADH